MSWVGIPVFPGETVCLFSQSVYFEMSYHFVPCQLCRTWALLLAVCRGGIMRGWEIDFVGWVMRILDSLNLLVIVCFGFFARSRVPHRMLLQLN